MLHFTWCDDFAAARNHALDAATQPWILTLDADERLDPSTVPALAEAVRPPRAGEPARPLAHIVPVCLLGVLVPAYALYFILLAAIVPGLVAVIYSYWLYQKKHAKRKKR